MTNGVRVGGAGVFVSQRVAVASAESITICVGRRVAVGTVADMLHAPNSPAINNPGNRRMAFSYARL
jgi:hypothetical protein